MHPKTLIYGCFEFVKITYMYWLIDWTQKLDLNNYLSLQELFTCIAQ